MTDRTGMQSLDSSGCARRRAALLALLLSLYTLAATAWTLGFPQILGQDVYKKSGLVVDASQAELGIISVQYKQSDKKLKVRVSRGDELYTYDLNQNGEYDVYPLQMGSGKYKVQLFRQASGDRYSAVASVSFRVELPNEMAPYLCPNQYVWYGADSQAAALSVELCAGLDADADKVRAIYDYVTRNILYDYILALTVPKGYLPDVDSVLAARKGICFDVAALMACMLRTQDIPTQLVIGYADRNYHAWNNVYVDGQWLRYDATAVISNTKVNAYTQERVY